MIQLLLVLFSALNMSHAAPVTQPFLYEIQKNGQTAYMLGTVHADIQVTDFPVFMQDKLTAASTVIIETNLDEVQPLAMDLYTKPAAMPLNQVLTPVEWQRLVGAFAASGITEAQLVGVYPGMVLQQYIQLQMSNPAFLAAKAPILDLYILDYAQTNAKGVDYLEPAQVQFDILKYTMEDAAMLKEILALGTKAELQNYVMTMNFQQTTTMNQLTTAYYSGDLDALAQLSMIGMDDTMKTMLLVNRNKSWVPVFNRIIANEGTEFFAFGAGHLSGDDGVIKLLTQDGFTVTRVTQ